MADQISLAELVGLLEVEQGTIAEKVKPVVRLAGTQMAMDMRAHSPVWTGATQGSITFEPDGDGLTGDGGPETWYAPGLEYGTATRRPTPFVLPAGDRIAEPFADGVLEVAGELGQSATVTVTNAETFSMTSPAGKTYTGDTGNAATGPTS